MNRIILIALIGTAVALVKPDKKDTPKSKLEDLIKHKQTEVQKASADAIKAYNDHIQKEMKKAQDLKKEQNKALEQKALATNNQLFNPLAHPEMQLDSMDPKQKINLEVVQDPKLLDAENDKGDAPAENLQEEKTKVVEELKVAKTKCEKFVEILENVGNGAAYVGKSFIGGQKMDIVWDTGSDEYVVNSVNSMNLDSPCMDFTALTQHDCYNRMSSRHYTALAQYPKKIRYGSGNTVVLPGTDEINFIGNKCINKGVKFMEIIETDIPQLQNHEIDAVGGLGTKNFEEYNFMSQMGIDRFSFCFLGDSTRPGKLIWNDDKPDEYPEAFKFSTMPIHGTDYWAIQATNFMLSSPGKDNQPAGCKEEGSCMCVVDSGTSLITLDQQTLKAVEVQLNEFEANTNMTCNDQNLKEFPIIKFFLNGVEHQFHPQDYLMYTEVNELPAYVREVLHFNSMMFPWLKEPESKKECVMMFTPPMGDGLCILGMPFFRNYLVQFDREFRTVSTAPHDGECKPAQSSFMQLNTKNRIQPIDPTKIRVSAAYYQLKQMAADNTVGSSFLHQK